MRSLGRVGRSTVNARGAEADHAPCMHAAAGLRRTLTHTLVRARVRFRRRRVIIKSGDGRVLLLRVRHPFLRHSIPAAVDDDTSHAHAGRSSVTGRRERFTRGDARAAYASHQ